ncbi:hypothetical protein U1Q18_027273 [Sarracenia purpurea var. burkii]
MGRTSAITCVILFVSLLLPAPIGFSSSSSRLVLENQDTEGYAAKRTLKQEEQHAQEVHCSRERSRAAWKIIEEYLMPFVEQEKYQISRKCRLHQENDIFRDQEQHKIHVDVNEWQCGYCKKIFRAEKFLDQHFDDRHYDLLNVKHPSIFYLATSILSLMLLPIFYLIVYLYRREMRKGTQELKRISQLGRKAKPS